ncbi:hypothetical protein A2U01_0108861, partial [Trifolium medium]|nr:hypothetical protein [Trifolium medium]
LMVPVCGIVPGSRPVTSGLLPVAFGLPLAVPRTLPCASLRVILFVA